MEPRFFDQYLEKAQTRLDELFKCTALNFDEQQELLNRSMQELTSTLEELHAATEELRERNEQLATAQQHYQELFDFAPDAYLITDRRGLIQQANRAAARLFRYPVEQLEHKPLVPLVSEPDQGAFLSRLAKMGQTVAVARQEWELMLRPRGAPEFPAALTVATVRDPRAGQITLRWSIRDIAERKRAQERLRALARESILSQEQERQHVSQELFSQVGQALAATQMHMEALEGELAGDCLPVRKTVDAIAAQLKDAVIRVESLAGDLRPPALEIVGLDKTLEEYCRAFAIRTRVIISYAGAPAGAVPDALSILVYRVLQGLLVSVTQQGQAQHIHVALEQTPEQLRLVVEHDGQVADENLLGMRDRLQLVGGKLENDFQPLRGAHIVVQIPAVI